MVETDRVSDLERRELLEEEVETRGASQWQLVWRRFKKNKTALFGAGILLVIVFMGVSAPFLTFMGVLPDPNSTIFLIDPPELGGGSRALPSIFHPLGTDKLGRDVLSRIFWGAQTALIVGIVAMLISTIIALAVGGLSGYFGGRVDASLMMVTDVFLVMPVFLIMLLMIKILTIFVVAGFGLWIVITVLGIFGWPQMARMIRAEFFKLKNLDYVEAARELGASNQRIMFRHILPNALGPIIVVFTLGIAYNILAEAGLSFLGFGDASIPSWGWMINMALEIVSVQPWLVLYPAFMIFFTVLAFNLMGDGLADALDPRLWR
ncbi:MAG: ABC transporter permease [Candidatus Odinarchaeota archaeon]